MHLRINATNIDKVNTENNKNHVLRNGITYDAAQRQKIKFIFLEK